MTHPIVEKFLKGEMDAGGTIHSLEIEIENLTRDLIRYEVRREVDIRRIEALQYRLTASQHRAHWTARLVRKIRSLASRWVGFNSRRQ